MMLALVRCIIKLNSILQFSLFKQGPDGLPMPGCWQKVRSLKYSYAYHFNLSILYIYIYTIKHQ